MTSSSIGTSASRLVFSDSDDFSDAGRLADDKGDVTVISTSKVISIDGDGKKYMVPFPAGIIVDSYSIGPFSIKILGGKHQSYQWRLETNSDTVELVAQRVAETPLKASGTVNMFTEIYAQCVSASSKLLVKMGISHWLPEFSNLCALCALGLGALTPIFVDTRIEEAYLDRPGALCYVDHSDFGRLWFPAITLRTMQERLQLYIQLSVSGAINRLSNSLKGHLITDCFHIRASVDTEPLAVDGGNCILRKFNFEKLSLTQLVLKGTLNDDCAALLIGAMMKGYTIVVSGLPRSGKTTLCNALMKYLPEDWRKLSIEDVVETSRPSPTDREVRFSTESGTNLDKLSEVTKSLHRSPDFIFIGELQTKEQTVAATMLMDLGLPSMQTVHATSLEGLLARWRDIYSINIAHKGKSMIIVFVAFENSIRIVRDVLLVRWIDERLNAVSLYASQTLNWTNIGSCGMDEIIELGRRTFSTNPATKQS